MENAPTTAPTTVNLRRERNRDFLGLGVAERKGSEAAANVGDVVDVAEEQ